MTPETVQALFTRRDGSYLFSRWGRPIVPVVFGVQDETLAVVKGAVEAVVTLAGHRMAETDSELGANLMMFFLKDWAELRSVRDLEQLVPGLEPLCARLQAGRANHYRLFRFDAQGAIKAAFVFIRLEGASAELSAQDLALNEVVRSILLWSDAAFAQGSPLARLGQTVILRPEIAEVIKAGYDPLLPPVARDAAHALRLAARVQLGLRAQGL